MLTMNQAGHWDKRPALTEYLAYQLVKGRVSLLLGAGICYPFKLPDWKELQRRMFHAVGRKPPAELNLRSIEGLRLSKFSKNHDGFLDLVHKQLYSTANLTFDSLSSNRVLMSIASLVMSSRRGSASTVVTVNYDDVLESLLNYFGYVTSSRTAEKFWAPSSDVTIYHPHGYLPHRKGEQRSEDIVLDQSSFSKIVGKSELPWHQALATILRTHTMLFIGIGGDDPNIDSLLVQTKENHVAMKEVKYWGVVFNTSFSADDARFWKSRGLYPCKMADYETDLAPFLLGVCQAAAEARRESD